MRKLSWVVVVALMTVPMTAEAGFIIEGSVGSGFTVKPNCCNRTPTNVMIAPGYGLGEMIRAELGVVGNLADVENSEFDLQLRPMLVIDPPILPIYGRLVLGVFNILSDADTEIAYGGAVGVGFSLLGLGVFGEVGYIPVGGFDTQLLEGRVGAYYAF